MVEIQTGPFQPKKTSGCEKKQNSWFIIMFPMRNGHRLVPSENPENRLVVDGYHPLSTGVVLLNLMLSLELKLFMILIYTLHVYIYIYVYNYIYIYILILCRKKRKVKFPQTPPDSRHFKVGQRLHRTPTMALRRESADRYDTRKFRCCLGENAPFPETWGIPSGKLT